MRWRIDDMDKQIKLSDGDKIELIRSEEEKYNTVITEVVTEKMFLVPVPTVKLKHIQINEGDKLFLAYVRDRGKYVMETVVRSIVKRDEILYAALEQLSEPVTKQLREFFRIPVDVKVKVSKLVAQPSIKTSEEDSDEELASVEIETTNAKDLSVTGLSIESKAKYKSGERFMLTLNFYDKRTQLPPLTVFSEAMRVEVDPDGTHRVGMKFVGLTTSMSDQLAKFLLAAQQKQIIKKKLREGL